MIRSKARWVEYGEKPSKYFWALEKKNYTSRLISKLDIEGEHVTHPKRILEEQTKFTEDFILVQGMTVNMTRQTSS